MVVSSTSLCKMAASTSVSASGSGDDSNSKKFEVRHGFSNKGKALFAVENISKGEVIFEEQPLVCCQFSWNALYKYKACDHCMRSMESAEEMAKRLSGNPELVLPHPECCETNKETHVACPYCQAAYCSSQCKDAAWKQYHKTLCLGMSAEDPDTPLGKLVDVWRNLHYPPETTSIMLLVRAIATVRQAEDKDVIMSMFNEFCQTPINMQEDISHKLLGGQFQEQLDTLRTMVLEVVQDEDVTHWLSPEGFRSLFALVGTNGQGVGSSSVSTWVHNCDDLDLADGDRTTLDAFIDQLYVEMDNESGTFLDCEGSGLYRLQSSINHSCCPSAEVTFPFNNFTLALKATEDIKQGDEISISYLNECARSRSRHSRQKELKENYLFLCACPKCIAQADDEDVTSEEDDEEMEED